MIHYDGLTISHDDDAKLTYSFDWQEWLATGESLTSHSIIAATGITVHSSSISGDLVLFQISASATGTYPVTCQVTATSSGDIDQRSVNFLVEAR